MQRVMCNLAQALTDSGAAVHVLTPVPHGEALRRLPDTIEVKRVGGASLSGIRGLVAYLKASKPHAIISAVTRVNLATAFAARLAGEGTKTVVTKHVPLSVLTANRGLQGPMIRTAIRIGYRRADAIVAVSHGVADDFVRGTGIPRSAVRVIYNPVISPSLETLSRAPVEHPWFQNGAPPVIVAVGRLAPQKDFATLLRAFAELRRHRAARLAIFGEGEDRETLEAIARRLGVAHELWMPGHVDNPYKYVRRSGAFALSSRFEGLPTVLIEALAVGASVAATDCPEGPREILRDGALGRLVPVADPASLAAALSSILDGGGPRPPPLAELARYTFDGAASAYMELLDIGPR